MKNTVIFCDRCGGVGVRGEVLFGSYRGHFLCMGSCGGPGLSDFFEGFFVQPVQHHAGFRTSALVQR